MPIVKYKNGNNWFSVTSGSAIATTSTYGYVKIANDDAITIGTDNTAVITAKQIKDY